MIKECSQCKNTKDISEFSKGKRNKGGYINICKPCTNGNRRGRRSETPDQKRNAILKYQYGITLEDEKAMFSNQEGCCLICKTPEYLSLNNKLVVDHCHVTNTVRGLLCHHCNTGLGLFRDNPLLLKEAIDYLNK